MHRTDQNETYAVSELSSEDVRPGRLSLSQAFTEILRRAAYKHEFEIVKARHRLLLTSSDDPSQSEVILSDYGNAGAARRDLMLQAVDGRLKGYFAIPDSKLQRNREAAE